ncbi:DUF917 family protein [Vibrio ostreicida]|uniref:S-methyl thiohydantoin desulfurase domain-containing protein n=1 Tax=Vibrio ostreicida TaxID=526588 RepID=UPI0009702467|nr:DUF917 family protein [Vibrio ostreicida]
MALKTLNRNDLSDIIKGSHFYACGGGGALNNGEALLKEIDEIFQARNSEVTIEYINSSDVKNNDRLPVMAAMGAPQKFLEKGYGKSPISAFEYLEKLTKTSFSALSPVETGPIAYGMSLLIAAKKGIPIVNGDGGGRAFPCLQLSTFANNDLKHPIDVSPCVIASEKPRDAEGGVVVIDCKSSADVDAMTRGIISNSNSFDDRASLAAFSMTGTQLKQPNAFVPDMLLKSKKLGAHIRECLVNQCSCFDAIEALEESQCVMRGKLENITSFTVKGFDWVVQEYVNPNNSEHYFVISQNENMLLWSTTKPTPIAMAPDLICCLSSDASLMSNDEILNAWNHNHADPRFDNMAIFTLTAPSQIEQPWFHDNFSTIFKRFGYFGCYHPPEKAQPSTKPAAAPIKIKIVIPVNTDEFTKQISKSVDKFRSKDVIIDLEPIKQGTPFIQSRIDLAMNSPFVIDEVIAAEKSGYDGVFVTDMDMCGVEAARQAVKIPVIGGFRPSFYNAMLLGQKVSILTVSNVVDLQNEHVRAFGVTQNLASILPLQKSVNELKNPNDANKQLILVELFELASQAIQQDGADSFMFGCTGFTDFATPLSTLLSERFEQNIPVMDPNCCAIGYLIMLIKNNLSQSGLSYPYNQMTELCLDPSSLNLVCG